jgi:HK97 gp10 family phage protein
MLRPKIKSSKDLTVHDLPLHRILRELDKTNNSYVKVGFPENTEVASGRRKAGTKLEGYSNASELISVVVFQEFGTKHIPARPFVSTSFDENKEKINSTKKKLYERIIQGNMTTENALRIIGIMHVNQMKRKIRDISSPPNAPSTIKKKGSSNPLIDKGQMINSVTHEVVIR